MRWVPESLQGTGRRLLDRAPFVALVLAGVVAANLLVLVLFTRPRLHKAWNAREILRAKESDLSAARREVDRLERRLSKIRCAAYDVKHFDEEILGGKVDRMTAVRREVRDIARSFNMDPENVSYNASPLKDSGLTQFKISFPLNGSYASLRQFLQRVESSRHFLIIDEVSLTGSREGGISLNLSIQMTTFFRPPVQETAAPPATQPGALDTAGGTAAPGSPGGAAPGTPTGPPPSPGAIPEAART